MISRHRSRAFLRSGCARPADGQSAKKSADARSWDVRSFDHISLDVQPGPSRKPRRKGLAGAMSSIRMQWAARSVLAWVLIYTGFVCFAQQEWCGTFAALLLWSVGTTLFCSAVVLAVKRRKGQRPRRRPVGGGLFCRNRIKKKSGWLAEDSEKLV